jgi:hypothetical protein
MNRGENLMRRASTCLALLGLVVVGLPAAASAAGPTVKLEAKTLPIPGYTSTTGNKYGAGAAEEAKFTIAGTEYGGFPAPLIGVKFYLPTGTKIHSQGFKTCPTKTIELEKSPEKCPKTSAAGPIGVVNGVVSFGKTRVPEKAELYSFFAPNGGLEFFTFGHTPTTLEIPSVGKYVNLNGGGGFGPRLITKVPLVETVPNAPFASVESITVKIGAAYKSKGKTVYYGTVPKKGQCPKGGFKIKAELTFAEGGNESTPVTVPVSTRSPCPKK